MQFSAVLVTLAVLSAADAGSLFRRPLRFQGPSRFLVVPVDGVASGSAGGTLTSGVSETALGRTQIDSAVSRADGQTSGPGSSSFNTANADSTRTESLSGVSQSSDADASSVQNTRGAVFVPLGGLFRPPTFQLVLPSIGSAASGNADGSVTVGVSEGAGGFSRVTSVSSSAGGSARNGGSSVNTANASNSRTETVLGVSETSDTGATSVQTSRR